MYILNFGPSLIDLHAKNAIVMNFEFSVRSYMMMNTQSSESLKYVYAMV